VAAPRVDGMTLPEVIRARFLEVNGDHPMTAADDEYCRRLFVPLSGDASHSLADVHRLIVERRLPLPSYLLGDGTPLVHPGHLDALHAAGGPDEVEGWFRSHWAGDEQDIAAEEWDAYLSGQYVCLYRVTPTTIQAKTRLIEQIKSAAASVDASPEDVEAHDQLEAAVDTLDELEPPFAPYDRLRFGGPSSREVWIEGIRERYLAPTPG
jgi:hypothetical protein